MIQALRAGKEGNRVYQSQDDAVRDAYTSLLTGLQFVSEARLGRPLGSFDRPRPRRADARRSGRSLRHVEISLASLGRLAGLLSRGEAEEVEAKVNAAFSSALEIAGVAEAAGRLRVEILQQRVGIIRETVASEIGPALGIAAGFNALDGD